MRTNNEIGNITTEDPLRLYLREIGRYPLLTREGEIEVMKTYEHGVLGQSVIESITDESEQDCTNEEYVERGLIALIGKVAVDEGHEAKNTMVNSNLRLSVSIAKRYQNVRMPLLDLIQEGNTGLISAVERFDIRKGFKFSTYASWWVKQAVARAVANQGTTIRTPVHMHDNITRLHKIEREIEAEMGHVDDEILCEKLGISLKKLHKWQIIAQQYTPLSLDERIRDDSDAELSDMVPDSDSEASYQRAGQQLDFEELWNNMINEGVLNDRELEVIRDRFGLFGAEVRTLEEIGRESGVTRERIRQIEQKALSKIRKANVSFSLLDHVS